MNLCDVCSRLSVDVLVEEGIVDHQPTFESLISAASKNCDMCRMFLDGFDVWNDNPPSDPPLEYQDFGSYRCIIDAGSKPLHIIEYYLVGEDKIEDFKKLPTSVGIRVGQYRIRTDRCTSSICQILCA